MKKIILLLCSSMVFVGCASTPSRDYMSQMEQRKAFLKTTDDQLLIEESNFISILNNDQRETLKKWETVQPTQEEFNKAWNTLNQKQQTEATSLIRRRMAVEQEKKTINTEISPQTSSTEYERQLRQRRVFLENTDNQWSMDADYFEKTLNNVQFELLKKWVSAPISSSQEDMNNFYNSLDKKQQTEFANIARRKLGINQEREAINTEICPQTPTQTKTQTVGFWDVLGAILSNVHGTYTYGYPTQTYQEQQNQQIIFNQMIIQSELNRIRNQLNPPRPSNPLLR